MPLQETNTDHFTGTYFFQVDADSGEESYLVVGDMTSAKDENGKALYPDAFVTDGTTYDFG